MTKRQTSEVQGSARTLRRIRCVTFDCYGTLIDWESGISRALGAIPALGGDDEKVKRLVRRREEIEKSLLVSAPDLPDEDSAAERYESVSYRPYRQILAESIQIACRELGIEVSDHEASGAAGTMSEWEPFPDTRRALEAIRERFEIGVLSNVEDAVIEATIRKIGVPFDLVVTAEKVESYKPSPDHWYAAMHEMMLDEDEILHLAASSFHDLETATLLGIPCGYVDRSGSPLLPEAKPLFIVPDLAGAAERLKNVPPSRARQPEEKSRGRHGQPNRPHRGAQGGAGLSRGRR